MRPTCTITMRPVDDPQYAVNHRQTERYQRIGAAKYQTVHYLLNNFLKHGFRASLPSRTAWLIGVDSLIIADLPFSQQQFIPVDCIVIQHSRVMDKRIAPDPFGSRRSLAPDAKIAIQLFSSHQSMSAQSVCRSTKIQYGGAPEQSNCLHCFPSRY